MDRLRGVFDVRLIAMNCHHLATRLVVSGFVLTSSYASAQLAIPTNARTIEQSEQDEHRRIDIERADADRRYEAQEFACRQRFVVSSCIEDAQRTRRAALQPLRERQIEIDTARRKRASAERAESIAKKATDEGAKSGVSMSSRAARKGGAASSAVDGSETASKNESAVGPTDRAASAPGTKMPSPSKPVQPHPLEPRIKDEAANRAAFTARRDAAVQHRRDVEARNAEQAKKRKPANPLASSMSAEAPFRSASSAAPGGSDPVR